VNFGPELSHETTIIKSATYANVFNGIRGSMDSPSEAVPAYLQVRGATSSDAPSRLD
jgi:hypothetical protein